MNRFRASSSPELVPTTSSDQPYDDSALEGVAAHIKLLLKLIQDHKDACDEEKNEKRRMLRVATMMTILDNVRGRIQKCQSFGNKKPPQAWGNTELRANNNVPRDKKHGDEPVLDEKQRLRKELNASLAARKSLQIMCSSLGKEKEIMAAELSRKAHEFSEMEDIIDDLKEQNETLLEKLQECSTLEHKAEESQGNIALQEKYKVLSEQLLRSLDGYKSMKRKLKEAQEENAMMHSTMDEMREKVVASLERVRSFKERLSSSQGNDSHVDVQEEIVALENTFQCFQMLVEKHEMKQGDCMKLKCEINACKPSVLA